MTLVFGPPQGSAGVRGRITDDSVPLTPGGFGTQIIMGAFKKGPVDRPVVHFGGRDNYRRVRKDELIVEDQTPLMVRDFFRLAEGAGTLVTYRVSDDNEVEATLKLFDRDVDTNIRAQIASLRVNAEVGYLTAGSPGAWAGRTMHFGAYVTDGAAAISGATFATGLTRWTKDELVGASFTPDGGNEHTITENTAAGVITLDADLAYLNAAASPLAYELDRAEYDSTPVIQKDALECKVKDGIGDSTTGFGLEMYEDDALINNGWTDLVLDSDARAYWKDTVNRAFSDGAQHEAEVNDDAFAGEVADGKYRPANWAEIPAVGGVGTNTITFEVWRWLADSGNTGDGYLDAAEWAAGAAVEPHYLKLTLTGAAAYTVEAYDLDGRVIALNCPNGTVGSAYAAPFTHLAGHKVVAGGAAFVADDILYAYCRALPSDLADRGAWFHPFAYVATGAGSQDTTTRYRVKSSTYRSITLATSVDLSGVCVEPGEPYARGITADGGAWDTRGLTFKYQLVTDGVAAAEETLTLVGTDPQSALALAIELEAKDLANNDELVFSVYTDAAGDTFLQVTRDTSDYGDAIGLKVTTGTLNAVVGFSNNSTTYGEAPTVGRIEWKQPLKGGRDGHHDLAATDYTDLALDVEESPFITELAQYNLGLKKLRIPGVSDTDVHLAAGNFVASEGWAYGAEFPVTIVTEDTARAWAQSYIPTQGHTTIDYPCHGYRRQHPFGAYGDYLSSIGGAVAGIEAKMAQKYGGFQKAPAGQEFDISAVFKRLITDTTMEPEPVKDYLLNPLGIRAVMNHNGSIRLWGARMPSSTYQGPLWTHKLYCALHLVEELRSNLLRYTFDINDPRLRGKVTRTIRDLMRPHWRAGWFEGGSFDAAVSITCNESNNPSEVRELGRVVAEVSVTFVNTAEEIDFTIGTQGIAVSI
jgi:hypothetical protein